MKTLDAKTLKAKKENLHAQFEAVKKRGAMFEKAMLDAQREYQKCANELTRLSGAYKAIEDLEKELGVGTSLPANKGVKPQKKHGNTN